jgi:hypothetical protein
VSVVPALTAKKKMVNDAEFETFPVAALIPLCDRSILLVVIHEESRSGLLE